MEPCASQEVRLGSGCGVERENGVGTGQVNCSLNSLKWCYIGDYMGDCYGGYQGRY